MHLSAPTPEFACNPQTLSAAGEDLLVTSPSLSLDAVAPPMIGMVLISFRSRGALMAFDSVFPLAEVVV